jgi:hypothetical protein
MVAHLHDIEQDLLSAAPARRLRSLTGQHSEPKSNRQATAPSTAQREKPASLAAITAIRSPPTPRWVYPGPAGAPPAAPTYSRCNNRRLWRTRSPEVLRDFAKSRGPEAGGRACFRSFKPFQKGEGDQPSPDPLRCIASERVGFASASRIAMGTELVPDHEPVFNPKFRPAFAELRGDFEPIVVGLS